MTSDPLAWQEFNPGTGEPPMGVELWPIGGEEEAQRTAALTVLASPGARRDGWAARAALSLAGTWSRTHEATLLADLDLRRPELHGLVGASNGEGVTDAVLWGASLDRVQRPADGEGLALIPAGTVVPDPEGVYGADGWRSVAQQAAAGGRSLVLYLPQEEPGALPLARRSQGVVLLALAEEAEELTRNLADLPVRAVLGPGGRAPEAGTGPSRGEDTGEWRPRPAPTPPGETRATAAKAGVGAASERDSGSGPAGTERGKGKGRSGRNPLLWVLILVLVVAGAVLVADRTGLLELPF